jgi:predicted transposase/invertase (TIGR01784 family)
MHKSLFRNGVVKRSDGGDAGDQVVSRGTVRYSVEQNLYDYVTEDGANLIRSKFISPFNDYGFKRLFGQEDSKDLLIDFLNALLDMQESAAIRDITYLNTEQTSEFELGRRAVLDLFCQCSDGRYFVVEMQAEPQHWFIDRALYYTSWLIQHQATTAKNDRSTKWDYRLANIYFVGLMNFSLDKESPKFYHDLVLTEKETDKIYSDRIRYVFLEFPKFKKRADQLQTHLDQWIFLLANLSKFEERPPQLWHELFQKLFDKAEVARMTFQEQFDYMYREKVARDIYLTEKNRMEKATEKGLKRGMKQGLKQGRAKGIAEGRAEGKALAVTEIVQRLHSLGEASSLISKITGLNVAEVEKILTDKPPGD